jgi:hypothetical protein
MYTFDTATDYYAYPGGARFECGSGNRLPSQEGFLGIPLYWSTLIRSRTKAHISYDHVGTFPCTL